MAEADVAKRSKQATCHCGGTFPIGEDSDHEKSTQHLDWLEKETSPAAGQVIEGDLFRILEQHPDLKRAVALMNLDDPKLKNYSAKDRPFLAAKLVRQYYAAHGWGEFGAPDGMPKTIGDFCELAKIPDILNEREKIRKAEFEERDRRKRARTQ